MAVQMIVLACLLAGAYAGGLGLSAHGGFGHAGLAVHAHAAPVALLKTVVEPVDPHPKYSYSYGVDDPHTGDHKGAEEHRDGKTVHGSYWLKEADGSKRVVHYTSDPHSGFNAVVSRQHNTHPSGPISHGHGGGHYGGSAPAAHFSAPSGHASSAHYAIAAPAAHYGHASSYANTHHIAHGGHAVVSHVAHAAPVIAHAAPVLVSHSAIGHSAPSGHGGHHW